MEWSEVENGIADVLGVPENMICSVIVLDEASMAGTRKLARLLSHAAGADAKLVLVGDTKQLSSVDAGSGFRGLVARLGSHRLLENRRQVER